MSNVAFHVFLFFFEISSILVGLFSDKLNRHHSPATTFSECLSKERFLERNQNSPLAAHSSDDNSNQNIPNNSNISSSLNNNSSNNNNNGSNNNSIGSNNNSSLNNNSTTNNGGSNLTHSHNNNSLHSGNNLNSGTDRGGQQHVGKHKEDVSFCFPLFVQITSHFCTSVLMSSSRTTALEIQVPVERCETARGFI